MANWAALQEQLMGKPVAKRAKHGIHFQNADGSITANFSGKPCHFQDTDGLWKPIDTKLLPLGDGFYGCPHSKVKVHPDGHVAVAGTDYIQRVTLPSAQAGLLDGDKLVRKFAFGEQRMWVTEDGFKSEIQLNRIPTLTEARKLIASESGTLSKKYLKSLTTATDANGDTHTYSTLTAFRTWLAQAQFPVVIDPDFAGATVDTCSYAINGEYSTARTPTNTDTVTLYGTAHIIGQNLGIVIYRSWVKFDTSSIPDTDTVTQVNLTLTATADSSTTDFDVVIKKQNWSAQDPPAAGNKLALYNGCLSADSDSGIWRNTSGMSLNTPYASQNLSTAWVSKTGSTYYGLISSRDVSATQPGGTEYCTTATTSNATESYRPVLTVTYTAGGSITPIVQYYNRLRRN